jgi:two-component system sensor histidine kinase SenX3
VSISMPRGLRVRGDSQRLTQVLRALVDNAVKFSPKGAKVKISGAARGGRVQLQVSDRGIGIEPGLHQQVFERFYQVDNTATRRYGGTGMGLALAQRLVEMHRGHIEVESRPGKGSTFTVVLPAGAPPAGNGATRAARNGASTRG